MNITTVDVVGKQIPLADDFPVSYEEHTATDHVFVRLETDTEHVGYGEGTALPWFTGETTASMEAFAREWLAPRIVDKTLDEAGAAFQQFVEAFPGNPGAKTAMEIALLDLRGKRADVPVRELLGPTVHETLPMVFPVPGWSPEKAASRVEDGIERGYRCFKIKATGEIPGDVARINTVLDLLPDDAVARIDANTGWKTYPNAMRAVRQLSSLEQVEYFEQPVSPNRPTDLQRLWHETGVPVFADEFVHGPESVERLGREGLAAGCQLKLAKTGSLTTLSQMATTARRHGMAVTVVSAFGTSLEASAMAHLAATVPNSSFAVELAPTLLAEDPVSTSLAEGAVIDIPTGPGVGVELDATLF